MQMLLSERQMLLPGSRLLHLAGREAHLPDRKLFTDIRVELRNTRERRLTTHSTRPPSIAFFSRFFL